MKRIVVACALVLGFAAVTSAQVDRATLSGTVRDASGALISGASVVVTNVATNETTQTKTNADGNYTAVNLRPGRYKVEAEAAGFQKNAQTIVVEVGQRARADFSLGVGTLAEAVTVEDTRRVLNTEQAALGQVIEQAAVANLPLASRNWDDLLFLVAGVQGDRYTDQGGGTSFGRTGGFNVHGQRSLQNNFTLDGVDNNTISENVQELTTQVSRPSIDAIQEFKIVTSPYSAEYGRAPGGAVSVTTKSGTNEIHGTGYEYFRNDSLDTIDFFSKLNNQPKLQNSQNQFGGNLGGPIIKDRSFFFVDYEGLRLTRGVTRSTRVPTDAERQGIFSGTVRDPLTGQPFANNTIPVSRFDPVAAAMLGLLPAPNQPGATNFSRQADLTDDSDRILGRVDFKATQNDSIFARYIYSTRDRFIPGWFGGIVDGLSSSSGGVQTIKSQSLVGGWTRVFSQSVVNEFRFSWNGAKSDGVQEPFGQAPPADAVVPGVPNNPTVAGGVTGVNISGYFGGGAKIGSPNFLPKFQHTNQFEFLNTMTWLRGNHAFKFGFDILSPMKNTYMDVPATRGDINFSNQFTGQAVGDFLLGYVTGAQLTNVHVVDQRHWATSFFVHDDWKVNTKLTLNLGLRYDFITPAMEAQNRQTNFRPEGAGTLVFASDGSLADRGLVNPDKNNFAPRIGIVFQADNKTVIRGGYGIFYNLFDRVGSEDQIALNIPSLINNVLQVAGAERTNPLFLLKNGFANNFLDPTAPGLQQRVQLRAVAEDAPKTTIHQASVGVQREFFNSFVLTVDGIMTWGRNLATLINLNQPVPTAAGNNALGPRPYPAFGSFIEWRQQNGESSYKGIDVTIERRFSRGFGFGLAYTLGNSRDNTSEHLTTLGSNSFPQNSRNLDDWEGPSDYDVRHRFVANFVAELPFGKGKKWAQEGVGATLLGNWTFSGIFTAHSGLPFTVNQSNNNVGTRMTGMPNLVGDPEGPQTQQKWFNTDAFVAVPSGTFGNAGRNILRGPDWRTFDFTLARKIDIGSRVAAQLRWDVFNAFNRTNFGLPVRNRSDASIGQITTLAGDPRIMQLSIRLQF
jgi:Carboxypeptidase regulatory-like domain/TonB-dependent Receptor Plug Domain